RITLHRSDLDGAPRAGEASWRLLRLRQPERALLPADQPLPADPRQQGAFRTPGDQLRPRWETDYNPDAILHQWQDGEEVGHGPLRHGDKGIAELTLPSLPAGAYRLRYATKDPFGATFETSRELLVVEAGETPLALPALLRVERPSVPLGGVARVLVHSGLPVQQLVLEIQRRGRPVERRVLESSNGTQVLAIPIGEHEHGGFGLTLTAERDHQVMEQREQVLVPWDEKKLKVEFATFRDRMRPRSRETWRVTVHGADQKALAAGAAELLAYMYDRSLDLFAPHNPPDPLAVYPGPPAGQALRSSLGGSSEVWRDVSQPELPDAPSLTADELRFLSGYGIGGPGGRMRGFAVDGEMMAAKAAPMSVAEVAEAPPPPAPALQAHDDMITKSGRFETDKKEGGVEAPTANVELRSEFAETAFWYPHLLTGADGSATFEFTVPDSVTEWNLWVHAITEDLRAGSTKQQVRTVKELMVRPYLPRFLREGDQATLQVVVNDAGDKPFAGTLRFEILDPASGKSLADAFGLPAARTTAHFSVKPGGGATLAFPVKAPARVGIVSFRVTAQAGDWSDGELRPLPVLPGRMHLAQSRFATLRDKDRRVLRFDDMARNDDATLLHDQLVVTVDGQLFNTVLAALPYLVQYPYECTEQTLNRFLSTAIVSKVFADHPALAKLGQQLAAQRDTPLAPWALDDPNRRMTLEETPWLVAARGGDAGEMPLIKVLDPKVAAAQRDGAMAKLQKAQTSSGGFPWWDGGPPSPYMTLYLLAGLSRARDAGIAVPRDMVLRAWQYTHRHYLDEIVTNMQKDDCCWETVTLLGFVLSSYEKGSPGEDWTGGVFTAAERKRMLDFSFKHWKQHSPLLKSMLALSLHREKRAADAKLVFDSIMDSAKTTTDEGTFWAPEDRGWLWYNDTIETHAFALRALSELAPSDARRHGLVQWLLLNKKLNHWESTRGTAEVIYALVGYMEKEGELGIEEDARVTVDGYHRLFRFLPDRLEPVVEGDTPPPAGERTAPGPAAAARANQLLIPGSAVDPRTMAEVVIEKETKGFLFASATWQFSTEKLPAEARGDLFSVTRAYFRRLQEG
ncbi:MAG TPA: alpha-2-macroglobulin family protein, partial [Thermoanaerobaculia bacterium]|nr:alpha-2-macroglobulin family protein [Thermoanaerobaculia bacterium]